MHPTTARYLAESRQRDLYAEAARERLAREAHHAARSSGSATATAGILTTVRSVFASIFAAA